MNILFNVVALAILWLGEWWDYSSTMKLHKKGWLNTEINDRGQHVKVREKNQRYMKNGVFQEGRLKIEKILFTIVPTVATILILIFVENEYYHIAPFFFNLIVGMPHLVAGWRNNKNYSYIEEVLSR